MGRVLLLGFSIFAFAALPTAASAQDDGTEQPSTVESTRYRELLAEALSEYGAGRYREARAMFDRAHEEFPNARTLRGIGMTSFELRQYVDSVRFLKRSLAHQVRPLTDEQRASVEALIERAGAFVGRYVVTVRPLAATLTLDGAPVTPEEDGAIFLDLGRHHLEVTCGGCRSASRVVEVRGGENEAMVLEAQSSSAVGALAPSPAMPVPGDDDNAGSDDGDRGGSVTAIVLLAGGGVLAGAAAGSAVWWVGRNDEVARCEAAGAACHNLDDLNGEQAAAAGVTIGLAAGAAIALTVGVVLLLTDGDDESDQAALVCIPALGGIACAGTF